MLLALFSHFLTPCLGIINLGGYHFSPALLASCSTLARWVFRSTCLGGGLYHMAGELRWLLPFLLQLVANVLISCPSLICFVCQSFIACPFRFCLFAIYEQSILAERQRLSTRFADIILDGALDLSFPISIPIH